MANSEAHHTLEVPSDKYPQPKLLLDKVDEQPDLWRELREKKVSGSNIAVICGLSPYKSQLQLWAEWTGKVKDEFRGNKATQIGLALEPLVAQWYGERHGIEVTRANALYGDTEFEWLVCSPDYFLPDGTPVEIKTGNFRTAHKWEGGKAPYHYVLQLQLQMRVLRKRRGVLTAYVGDLDQFPDLTLEYDDGIWALMREQSEQFIECVQRDVPPAAGPGDAALIREISGRVEGERRIYSEGEAALVLMLVEQIKHMQEASAKIRKELDALDREKKALENRVKQTLQQATVGELPDGRVVKLTTVHIGEKVVAPYSYERLTVPKVL